MTDDVEPTDGPKNDAVPEDAGGDVPEENGDEPDGH